jgi:tripartite-type tricarboxylate transporter receptor subunit TctC
VKEQILASGVVPRSSTPEAFDKLVRAEIATRRKVFAAAGAKPE